MTIWSVGSINDEPEIELTDWQIMETNVGSRHFVGYNHKNREGRVSSDIVTFDNKNLIGKTVSGRVYQLIGYPAYNKDALYVWDNFKVINGIKTEENVTVEVMKEIKL
jgi:hypothetical protein